ncbi:MAG: hypothetical protein IPP47_16160 [Bryobacterales bacterium]|nr:hypothetical protein [Bryobacterales bacterium]
MTTPNPTRRSVFKTMLAATAAGAVHGEEPQKDRIRLDTEYQTIENFGASDCWTMQKVGTWSMAARTRVADLLFSTSSGIGLSCWRFNIGGGLTDQITTPWRAVETFEVAEGQYDWTRQAPERWFLAAAKARGVPQFLAFVNSPPGRMTRTGITYGRPGKDTTNLKPGFEGQFARYLVDVVEHFRMNPEQSERIAFDYLSPINEPNVDWNGKSQEGCRASNSDIKAVLRALDAELRKRKCRTEIAGIEVSGLAPLYAAADKMSKTYGAPYGNYVDEFAGDKSVAGMLKHRFLYHDYGSDRLKGQLVEDRQAARRKFDQYPGWKPWMSEYCVMTGSEGKGGGRRDLTMNTALDVARILHLDLTLVGVTAWQWWTAMSGVDYKDGLIYTDWRKPGDAESVIPSRLLWAFGNYSRFVRPGMRRIGLEGAGHEVTGLMGSAYKDEKAKRVVAVYVNMAAQAKRVLPEFEARKGAWRLKSITPYVTSDRAGDELKEYPAAAPGGVIEIPARSVVTLVAQFG